MSDWLTVLRAVLAAFVDGKVPRDPRMAALDPPAPLSLYEVHRAQGLPPIGTYTTTLAGKTVIPSGYCPNRGPLQAAHIIPAGTSECSECGRDFAVAWRPQDDRRKTQPVPRADGLPDPVPPPTPLSVQAAGLALFVVVGPAIALLTAGGVLRWRAASPGPEVGHYAAATLRAAWARAAGSVTLAVIGWLLLMAGLLWGVYAALT